MSKDSSAKYYQKNKGRLQKKGDLRKISKSFQRRKRKHHQNWHERYTNVG